MSNVPRARPLTGIRLAARLLMVAGALLALWAPAQAGVSFQLGNHPQSNEENVLFNNDQTATKVIGFTNKSKIEVDFSSTTDTLHVNSSGQAKVSAKDGLVNNLKIDVPHGTFTDLIINPEAGSGTAKVTVDLSDGTTGSFSYKLGSGNNFLTILALDDENILSVTIDASKGFKDLKQPRISGASVAPEPSTMTLTLVGVTGLGLGAMHRFRRRAAVAIA
jgi:hypothetical protein